MSEIPDLQRPSPTEVPVPLEELIKEGRSPIVAGIMSAVLPGSGHMYLGLVRRGFSYFFLMLVMVGLVVWTRSTHEFDPSPTLIFFIIALAVTYYIWVIISAVMGALKRTGLIMNLGPILVLIFVYVIGWQATEVNLVKFFTEFSDTFSIMRRISWPWPEAIDYPEELTTAESPFGNPCEEGEIPEQIEGDGSEPWVVINPACGEFAEFVIGEGVQPGDELTVRGGGFAPNDAVEIWWEDPIGQEFQPRTEGTVPVTTTDSDGNFEITFAAHQYETPSVAVGVQVHHVQARQVASVGAPVLSPDFSLALGRMIVTIFQAMMATTFGIVLAVPFSFLAARNLMYGALTTRLIYIVVRVFLNIVRSIEPIIWAVIAAVWVGLGPFAGVIALTLHTIAALGKLYSEAIESIQPGPIEAVTATGANRIQTIMYAIVPQIIPPFLSFTIYRWDINVRLSTIIGFVGGGGIGQILFQWINQSRWGAAGMAVWLITITVAFMDFASAELRKRFI